MTAGTGAPATEPLRAPRWGYQASLVQPRQPAFWLFAILLAVTGLIVLSEQLQVLSQLPVSWIFSWILLAIYAVPVILAIYLLDLFEREPVSLLAGAFLWGGVVAIGLAAPTNTAWFEILFKVFGRDFVQDWGPALIGPAVEETIKFLGIVLLYLIARSEIDDLFDGFIYGAMVGLGFAVVENVQYFINPVAQTGGVDQIGPVLQSFLLRVVFSGLYMHVLWTGLTGIGLAYYITRRDVPQQRRLLVAAGFFALGVLAHFIWNSPLFASLLQGRPGPIEMLLFGALKGLPFLGFLIVLVVLAQRRERRWFGVASASEVGDTISPEDVTTLGDLRSRWEARRRLSATHGPAAGKLLGRLQREQINLVMVRTRVDREDHPDLVRQREVVRAVREQLASVPPLPVAPVTAAPVPSGPFQAPGADAAAPTMATPATPATPVTSATATAATLASPPAPPPTVHDIWTPTHRVPDGGLPAWAAPDPGPPPIATLAERLEVRVVERVGDWARITASNGWSGWVDGRRLIALGGA